MIREVYDEVSTAVDEKLIVDATGRNALYKIHVSLGKIVNSMVEKEKASSKGRKSSVTPSVMADEDRTVLTVTDAGNDAEEGEEIEEKTELVKVEEGEESDGTVRAIDDVDDEVQKQLRDSLVESLLSDDDVEMSGM